MYIELNHFTTITSDQFLQIDAFKNKWNDGFVLKMMNFVLRIMDFELKIMDFVLTMVGVISKMMEIALQKMKSSYLFL